MRMACSATPTRAAAVSTFHSSSTAANCDAGPRTVRSPSRAERSASGADAWLSGPDPGGVERTATISSPSTPITRSATAPAGTSVHVPVAVDGNSAIVAMASPATTSASGNARAATMCSTSGMGAMARP